MRNVAVAMVVSCLIAAPAFACSCVRIATGDHSAMSNGEPVPSVQELQEESLVIFLGKAGEMRPIPSGHPCGDEWFTRGSRTTFRVLQHWEKELPAEVTVESGFPGGGCGSVFEAGRTYMVFATREKGVLTTGICTRTTLDEYVPDLREEVTHLLGAPKEP